MTCSRLLPAEAFAATKERAESVRITAAVKATELEAIRARLDAAQAALDETKDRPKK
jgi:hypothetical protein